MCLRPRHSGLRHLFTLDHLFYTLLLGVDSTTLLLHTLLLLLLHCGHATFRTPQSSYLLTATSISFHTPVSFESTSHHIAIHLPLAKANLLCDFFRNFRFFSGRSPFILLFSAPYFLPPRHTVEINHYSLSLSDHRRSGFETRCAWLLRHFLAFYRRTPPIHSYTPSRTTDSINTSGLLTSQSVL